MNASVRHKHRQRSKREQIIYKFPFMCQQVLLPLSCCQAQLQPRPSSQHNGDCCIGNLYRVGCFICRENATEKIEPYAAVASSDSEAPGIASLRILNLLTIGFQLMAFSRNVLLCSLEEESGRRPVGVTPDAEISGNR
jgi:hypothetical protein